MLLRIQLSLQLSKVIFFIITLKSLSQPQNKLCIYIHDIHMHTYTHTGDQASSLPQDFSGYIPMIGPLLNIECISLPCIIILHFSRNDFLEDMRLIPLKFRQKKMANQQTELASTSKIMRELFIDHICLKIYSIVGFKGSQT